MILQARKQLFEMSIEHLVKIRGEDHDYYMHSLQNNVNQYINSTTGENTGSALAIVESNDGADFTGACNYLVQILDATKLYFVTENTMSNHPNRHLIEMEVMVWRCRQSQSEIVDECRTDVEKLAMARIHTVVDHFLEVSSLNGSSNKYLCMIFSEAEFESLMNQDDIIRYHEDCALCLGWELWLGNNHEISCYKEASKDKARSIALHVFNQAEEAGVLISHKTICSVDSLAFLDFEQDVEETSFRRFFLTS